MNRVLLTAFLAALLASSLPLYVEAAFAPQVPGTILAATSDVSWNPAIWKGNFSINSNLTRALVQDGILTHVTLPLGYFFDSPDFPTYFAILNSTGLIYDCRTPEKTLAEWGIYINSQGINWNVVTIGPFEGTQCDTALRNFNSGFLMRAFNSSGLTVNNNIGMPGYRDPVTNKLELPYIAYTADSVPVCTENCFSNVLFLPGIQSSALREGDNQLWPSTFLSNDIARLALNEDGTSVNEVRVNGVLANFRPGIDIYGEFSTFMDGLVADGTIHEWEPYAYDWRLPLPTTLTEGSEQTGGTDQVKLVEEVERLASESKSGKVTIVAHSMGGLLGKLLIQELERQGKADLIDTFVMVGTPQLGTPQAIASLLHGNQALAADLFARSYQVRAIAQNMETAYSLLPSQAYFATPSITPPVSFDENAGFASDWRAHWGADLDTYAEYLEFMTGTGVARTKPEVTNLSEPEVVRADLMARAEDLHTALDSYVFPSSIRVVQIAGWGLFTVKSLEYKNQHLVFPGYDVNFTTEGDNTVVYTSAIDSPNSETYYFNLDAFNSLNNQTNSEHRNLLSAEPVESAIQSLITQSQIQSTYFSTNKPSVSNIADRLLVATKSPVILGAYDTNGNFTGINPDQDLTPEALPIEEHIPGSTFRVFGDESYMFLPKGGSYSFVFKGTGNGPATIELGTFSSDTLIPETSYTDIPVTPTTFGSFSTDPVAGETFITLDTNGDGQGDTTIAPDGYVPPPTLEELIASLKVKISEIEATPKLKEKLLKKVEKLEKRIAKDRLKPAGKVIVNLEKKLSKKLEKGAISNTDSQVILDLLIQVEEAL